MFHKEIKNISAIMLILFVCSISSAAYFISGESIYHITSIASTPLYYLKLQIDHFHNFQFYPQYWSSFFYTGGPIHTGLGVYNPLLFLVAWCDRFSEAVILYDVLLKFIAGLGIYLLLRRFQFSILISLCCSIIYPFNPFYGTFGPDPQFSSLLCFIPYIILLIEKIAEKVNEPLPALQLSFILALVVALAYLAGNIQMMMFLMLFVVSPFLVLRTYFLHLQQTPRDAGKQRFRFDPIWLFPGFVGIALVLSLLLTIFELIPTVNTLALGDRNISSSYFLRQTLFSLCLLIGALLLLKCFLKHSRAVHPYFLATVLMILVFSQGIKTIGTVVFDNYFNYVNDDIGYFSLIQGRIKYYFTLPQLVLLLTGLFFFLKGSIDPSKEMAKSAAPDGKIKKGNSVRYRGRKQNLAKAQDPVISNISTERPRISEPLILCCLTLSYFAINFLLVLPEEHLSGFFPYYERYAFIPIPGVMIGLAYGLEYLGNVLKKYNLQYLLFAVLLILPLENYWVFSHRTLFTNDIGQFNKKSEEYRFLSGLRPTERVIDVYENEHKQWRDAFNPLLLPKWIMPIYFGAHTFSRVGIGAIPRQNAEYNRFAMPLYFGIDRVKPLPQLLNLAGVRYIFSLQELNSQKNLQLLKKGDEYYIYRNLQGLPRVLLFPKADYLKEKIILPTLVSKNTEELLHHVYLSDQNIMELRNRGSNTIYKMDDSSFESELGKVHIKKYEDEYIEIDCNIKEDTIFAITDTYFDGWKASIAGKEKKIVRADHIYRALKLSPGVFTLIMKYNPISYRIALAVSLATLVLTTSLWLFSLRYQYTIGRVRRS